jgi:Flp pilus assembly pilin Flp
MNFFKDESGQTILEYALIIAVLVLVIIAAVPNLRESVTSVFSEVKTDLDSRVDD